MNLLYSSILLPLWLSILSQSVESFSNSNQPSQLSIPSSPQSQFPTKETPPLEVLEAHLEAMKEGSLPSVYHLFSRARKLEIDEAARIDRREFAPNPSRKMKALEAFFVQRSSEGLLKHRNSCVLSIVGDPDPPRGRLATRLARVKVDSRYYRFTLTRQSPWDGGDPRDNDGYEKCWFIWEILPDGKGGQDDGDQLDGLPGDGNARRLRNKSLSNTKNLARV